MKRNLELIRDILIKMEESDADRMSISDFMTDIYDERTISYHLQLLLDVGFIEATPMGVQRCLYKHYIVKRITSFGYDYLDNIRDDTVWNKTKKQLGNFASSASLEVIGSVASSVILKMIGV
ncbi:DUF2513 domain-containing protein [Clostridioides difficile]